MSRMKSMFAVLILTAIAGFVPQAHAAGPVFKIVIAGSSAMWQSQALAAYKAGGCVAGGVAPCAHYTSKNFNLNDTRPTLKGGTTQVDKNTVWIVWDHVTSDPNCTTLCNVWAYIKVDSGVGDRCFFGQPRCNLNVPTPFPAPSNQISQTLWGDNSVDATPPATIQAKLVASVGPLVSAAATDIRPEDALFATCRANSALGGGADGLAGLGYNSSNASGACPTTNTLANLQGADIQSGLSGSTSTAHIIAFNISGRDPFSGRAVLPATSVSVGAAPVIFVVERSHELATATGATDAGLQNIFSGADCDAAELGAPAGTIDAYLREPLSGTMNTTEATVFRRPNVSGLSQETGVGGVAHNPLAGLPCTAGGARWRGIGTSEVITEVQNSFTSNGHDGIAYAFFSYGNVSAIANQAAYGYLTLDGVDGIFHKYGTTIDPGQPSTPGVLPAAANLPATCSGSFPCPEKDIWSGGLSFPNLRSGQYRAWSTLRLVSDGFALAEAKLLARGGNAFVENTVPDYVPFTEVGTLDPGLQLLRSHYTQENVKPVNDAITGDRGGDMGGCILHGTAGITPPTIAESDSTTKLAQAAPLTECVSVP